MPLAPVFEGNVNMISHIDVLENQNVDTKKHDSCFVGDPRENLYNLCIGCPDYPRFCNGPKLSEFLDIMLLRNFMRKIRDHHKITNEQIADKTHPYVSKATVAEFFSRKIKDFMWTTVAYIDHAMKLIILERQLGPTLNQNLVLDNPCPASSTKIQEMMDESARKLQLSERECAQLREKLEVCISSKQQEIQFVRDEETIKREHLKDELAREKENADRRYHLIVRRDWIIIALAIVCAVLLILTVMYLSWDYTHDGHGIFW